MHACSSCSSHINFGMVADEDSLNGSGVESLQCTVKDLAIWFADALSIGNQNGLKQKGTELGTAVCDSAC